MLKNKKILITLMLLIAILFVPSLVNAATVEATETTTTSTGAVVKWSYELSDGVITNLKCTNVSSVHGSLTIPSEIDGYTVTTINRSAFQDCKGLTSVVIPNTVTKMEDYVIDGAFKDCTGLTNVTLSNNLGNIGERAFSGCTGLTSITIPNSVTSIGSFAFSGCTGLTSVTLSKNLTMVDTRTFSGCSKLTEIELPNNVTTINSSAFEKCTNLKFIKIPKVTVSIESNAFANCENLTIFGTEGSVAQTYAENNNINFENIENWDKRNQNAGTDITAPTVSSMKLKYSNLMGYYNSTTSDYRIPRGAEIVIIVEFSEQITGTNIPTLTIKCGTGNNIELKNGTISGKNIVYTYTIKEVDEGLITAVSLTGGNVTDNDGNDAELSVKELVVQYGNGYAYANGSTEGSNSSNNNSSNNNNGSSSSEDPASNNDKTTTTTDTSKKDTTTAKDNLPNTGRVLLLWIIGIVAVSAIVAHIRYKKLYM